MTHDEKFSIRKNMELRGLFDGFRGNLRTGRPDATRKLLAAVV